MAELQTVLIAQDDYFFSTGYVPVGCLRKNICTYNDMNLHIKVNEAIHRESLVMLSYLYSCRQCLEHEVQLWR